MPLILSVTDARGVSFDYHEVTGIHWQKEPNAPGCSIIVSSWISEKACEAGNMPVDTNNLILYPEETAKLLAVATGQASGTVIAACEQIIKGRAPAPGGNWFGGADWSKASPAP